MWTRCPVKNQIQTRRCRGAFAGAVQAPKFAQRSSGSGSTMPSLTPHIPMPSDAPVIPSPPISAYPSLPPDTPEALTSLFLEALSAISHVNPVPWAPPSLSLVCPYWALCFHPKPPTLDALANNGPPCCSYLFIPSAAVNTPMMHSTSPTVLSTLPTNPTNSCINSNPITMAGPASPHPRCPMGSQCAMSACTPSASICCSTHGAVPFFLFGTSPPCCSHFFPISRFVPQVPYLDNSECVRLLQNQPGKLIHMMDDQARRTPKDCPYDGRSIWRTLGKSLIILSRPLRLPNIHRQSLQRTYHLLIQELPRSEP